MAGTFALKRDSADIILLLPETGVDTGKVNDFPVNAPSETKTGTAPVAKRVLVAPLDWGLGHATRCIPVIRALRERGCIPLIGADGASLDLLLAEFPGMEYVRLPGYGIRYARTPAGFGLKMAAQLPRIRRAIAGERKTLEAWLAGHALDGIISDNRFGLHVPGIPSVIMTHQLEVLSPFGRVLQGCLRQFNHHYLQAFDACWVVDYPEAPGLAGRLSHPRKLPRMPFRYLGCLSRFRPGTRPLLYDLTVLLSGPEPSRTQLEELLLPQLRDAGLRILVVRGLPGAAEIPVEQGNIRIVPHLDADALNEALLESGLILCRSGYSSVMDLVSLEKKAILIPTPGQTEQTYLGKFLRAQGYFPSFPQHGFRLGTALEAAARFPFRRPGFPAEIRYPAILDAFIASL